MEVKSLLDFSINTARCLMESFELLSTGFCGNVCNLYHRDGLGQREELVIFLPKSKHIHVPGMIPSSI